MKLVRTNRKQSGTTIVAIRHEGGIVFAADMQSTSGHLVTNSKERKVHQLIDHVLVGASGTVSDIQKLKAEVRSELQYLNEQYDAILSVRGVSQFFSEICYRWTKSLFYMEASFLIGGKGSTGLGLYEVSSDGACSEVKEFSVLGSGGQLALGVLENMYRPGLSYEEAKEVAVRAVQAAMKRDVYTGGSIEVFGINEEETWKVKV